MNDKYPKYLLELRDYLVGIRNYSKSYARHIIITINQFLNYINEYKYNNQYKSINEISLNEFRALTNSDIYGFIYSLAEKDLKDTTRILKLEHLKKFFDYLFITNKNTKITINTMKKIVKKAYKVAGLNTKLYAVHTLRHTCATLLIRNNIDIKVIQELLGHSRIETTQIYTHIYNKKVESEMLKHPLSKFKIKDAFAFVT